MSLCGHRLCGDGRLARPVERSSAWFLYFARMMSRQRRESPGPFVRCFLQRSSATLSGDLVTPSLVTQSLITQSYG
jgi:hypothetical protein